MNNTFSVCLFLFHLFISRSN